MPWAKGWGWETPFVVNITSDIGLEHEMQSDAILCGDCRSPLNLVLHENSWRDLCATNTEKDSPHEARDGVFIHASS